MSETLPIPTCSGCPLGQSKALGWECLGPTMVFVNPELVKGINNEWTLRGTPEQYDSLNPSCSAGLQEPEQCQTPVATMPRNGIILKVILGEKIVTTLARRGDDMYEMVEELYDDYERHAGITGEVCEMLGCLFAIADSNRIRTEFNAAVLDTLMEDAISQYAQAFKDTDRLLPPSPSPTQPALDRITATSDLLDLISQHNQALLATIRTYTDENPLDDFETVMLNRTEYAGFMGEVIDLAGAGRTSLRIVPSTAEAAIKALEVYPSDYLANIASRRHIWLTQILGIKVDAGIESDDAATALKSSEVIVALAQEYATALRTLLSDLRLPLSG